MDYRYDRNNNYSDFMIGWIGFMSSFNGKLFAGYSGNYPHRDYIGESIRNVELQIEKIQTVNFYCCGYGELQIPEQSIIYCDIPYRQTSEYSTTGFDHDRFWGWCALQKKGSSDLC